MKVYSKQGVCRKKMRIQEVNRKKRVAWCKEKRRWPFKDLKKVIISDESEIVIGNDNRVYPRMTISRSVIG
jgi:hypothetical protein